ANKPARNESRTLCRNRTRQRVEFIRGSGVDTSRDPRSLQPIIVDQASVPIRSGYGRLSSRPFRHPAGKPGEPAGWKACPTAENVLERFERSLEAHR